MFLSTIRDTLELSISKMLEPEKHAAATKNYHLQAVEVNFPSSITGKPNLFERCTSSITDPIVTPNNFGTLCVADAEHHFFRTVVQTKTVNKPIDILDIDSIFTSRSPLSGFSSIEEFGKYNYSRFRHDSKYGTLSENEYFTFCLEVLACCENQYSINCWAPSLMWLNSDGSHRFSTAYYMAKNQGRSFLIDARVKVKVLNDSWITSLLENYDIYLFTTKDYLDLFDIFDIHNTKHTFIRLANFSRSCDETVTLLFLHRRDKFSAIAKHWLKINIKGMSFVTYYQQLKDIQARTASQYL